MEPITISRGEDILAHYTTESCLSHYGQPVWTVEQKDVEPGPATWQQGERQTIINLLCVKGGVANMQTTGRPSMWRNMERWELLR